jgi:hypothetical protein
MTARRLHRFTLLLTGTLLFRAATAHAAEPTPPPSPKAEAPKPGAAPQAAPPKPTDEATKAEAARRFERGIKLFNAGDNAGALAEFKRIHDLVPNPVVLFNIGLVYAAMGRPVDAVDALAPAIQSGALSEHDLERAQQTFNDQSARVARLDVTTTPEGARIEVDNVQVAKTPLTGPIRIAEGSHIIGAVAEGYAPARKELVVAGNVDASLHLDLVPSQSKQLANLSLRSATFGAAVLVDGQPAGTTPLATSITLSSGRHVIELRRPGYVPGRREIDLGEGATGDVALDLAVDPRALETEGATLVIDASETPVEVSVDGERRGPYAAPLRVPRGPHRVTVTAAGFVPSEHAVNLDPSVTNVVRFILDPTPETRESHRSNALFHRTWGWIGVAAGAALAGGGVAFVALGSDEKSDGDKAVAEVERKLTASEAPCDHASGFASQPDMTAAACDQERADAESKVSAGKTKSLVGFVGIGVGGAVAITGIVLLVTGDDPDKYDQPRAKKSGPRFAILPGPGDFGAALQATF